MEMQPAARAGSTGNGGGPQLRHRSGPDRTSSDGGPPNPDRARSGSQDDWARIMLTGAQDSFLRQQSALERGNSLPPAPPVQVAEADAAEPEPVPPSLRQRAWAWATWAGRRVKRLLPFIPIYAATLTTVALIFALKNFNILDQSRAASLVRILRGEVGQAHLQILQSLEAFQAELNATLAALCGSLRDDR